MTKPKKKTHKYKAGDIVGICADCMADCEIVRRVRKRDGQALTYVAKAVKIHHPRPKESFFGKNPEFMVREKQISVLLRPGPTKSAPAPKAHDAIHAAHPTRSGSHEEYETACKMVGNRHSKAELVNLVNWLLVRLKAAPGADPHVPTPNPEKLRDGATK
jgi:hypothetical protein